MKRMSIGFIGIGNLGRAMVGRLLSVNEELLVWNRTLSKAEGLGCEVVNRPQELVERCDQIVLNLFDSEAVHSVLTMSGGLLAADCTGKFLIDTSTNHFSTIHELTGLATEHGAHYIEAPVIGSVVPATGGKLTMLVSGEKEPFENCRPLLDKIASTIYFLSTPGLATRMKLINNMVLGTLMASLAEAVRFGEAVGLSRSDVLDILTSGAGNSAVLNAKKQKLMEEDFTPHFACDAIHKDLLYYLEMAKEMNRPSGQAETVSKLYAETIKSGMGSQDFCAVLRTLA
ncbi:MAG: NAD(P)-dependent oxidoreductase [bacterium]|nr:NAD(P)-dependent oxidoreductase [bacterium]